MAALFSGAARAPITSLLIIFEMTRDYNLMLPLMTAVVAATALANFIDPLSIYTRRLFMQGIHLAEESGAPNIMQSLRVRDAMGPITVTLTADTPLDEITRLLADDRDAIALLLDEDGQVRGIVTNTDVNEALIDGRKNVTAIDLATTEVRTIFSDQSLHDALAVLAGRSFMALPVVDRERPRVPRGILRRADITNAYASAVEGRDATRRRGLLRPAVDEDVRYLDYQVRRASAASGSTLRDLPLTEDAVVVAVRRDGHTLIPRGNTSLMEGDRVTVIAAGPSVESVRALFEAP
jgi:CBS domain-containing protein